MTDMYLIHDPARGLWLATGDDDVGALADYARIHGSAQPGRPHTAVPLDVEEAPGGDIAAACIEADCATATAASAWDARVSRIHTCRVCGCSDEDACWPGCWWIEEDLCSACATEGGVQARRIAGIEAADLLRRDPTPLDVEVAGGAV